MMQSEADRDGSFGAEFLEKEERPVIFGAWADASVSGADYLKTLKRGLANW